MRIFKVIVLAMLPVILAIGALFFFMLPRWASDNPFYNIEIMYRMATNSSHQVVKGRSGWLFYQNSLLSNVLPWPHENAKRIIAFRDSLRSHGIELVMVPVPNKEYIYPEKISLFTPKIASRQRDELIRVLQSAGVHVVDLLPSFIRQKRCDDSLFDRYDMHWMDRAILLGAQEIADTIRSVIPEIADTLHFILKDTIENHNSDMMHLMGSDWTYPVRRSSVRTVDGTPIENDPHSPILIFGDSNVNMGIDEYASIGMQIGRMLGRPVHSVSRIKAGNIGPKFFSSNKAALQKKVRLFVWVFASRSLASPVEQP